MLFDTHRKKLVDNILLKINGQNLDIVDSYKYLGLTLDDKMSFQKHLYQMSGHVNYKICKVKEIRGYINTQTALTIFKSLVKPHLDYCDIIWDVAGAVTKNKIQYIQDKHETDSKKLHKITKTLPMDIQTEMHLVQHMFNVLYLPSPTYLTSRVEFVSHKYETRSKEQKDLKLMKPRNESLRKTIYYRAGIAWNKLPANLRLIDNKMQFKKKIKEHYLKRIE